MDSAQHNTGVVKWFSKEKGYGFITDSNNTDHYFSINDIIGAKLPSTGSQVQFTAQKNHKGFRAKSVKILKLIEDIENHVICSACNKKMVPRIILLKQVPHYSICPFCGQTYKKFIGFFRELLISMLK